MVQTAPTSFVRLDNLVFGTALGSTSGLPLCGNRVGFVNIGSVLQAQQANILT